MMGNKSLNILIFSSLFPSEVRKTAGLFVRERMFRMREHANLVVVSPVPYFPGQEIIKWFVRDYRPMPAKKETQDGVTVYYPRFLSFPKFFRSKDAQFLTFSVRRFVKKLCKIHEINIIDSHFTYPDGVAATTLAKELGIASTITMRGTEVPHSNDPKKLPQLKKAWSDASHVIAVSQSLKNVALEHGISDEHVTVVGNGIDTEKFIPLEKTKAKESLGISAESPVLATVGGLVYRKGFHRVIDCLPQLKKEHPNIKYLIVGGASLEGNIEDELKSQADKLGVKDSVVFCGPQPPKELHKYLSAADVFVLATANEGWANVLLEALACGTPVVATDVGGNSEVINHSNLGQIVPFGVHDKLFDALNNSLTKEWDSQELVRYAKANHWNFRIQNLKTIFDRISK